MAGEKEFVRLHKACCRSLEAFHQDSLQLLNALALVELFRNDVEKQTALEYHLKSHIGARDEFERRRRDLFDFIDSRLETSVGKKALRNRRLKVSRPEGGPKTATKGR